ncbi:gamma-glutamylcyclotransferase family protein [Amycolatopsis thailandensis]|uniref:Gamma-glutamylcyclotransferase n=1 Tax=Amycolatopsis thailandensis TaxID=589330 RepID=A0A229SET5_9PSEU|nr:gamma-glutamylcyclotransferase family protein [Amycolatopsis thailandensis]OXM57438.1 gamma-glutamylcyclotransferase [Amycolatopsis thailandensis]
MVKLFTDADFPADPYPGARPGHSFVHFDGAGHSLDTAPEGWRERQAVLAYGSNACPSKITWLRENMGLTGPVVVCNARCTDLAAVWASGLRFRDGQRPATLAAAPGIVEEHAVWFATPEQIAVLDECEGNGQRYRLVRLTAPAITLDDGTVLDDVVAYVGAADIRLPILVDGRHIRVADLEQRRAAALEGIPAETHGLDCTLVEAGTLVKEASRD